MEELLPTIRRNRAPGLDRRCDIRAIDGRTAKSLQHNFVKPVSAKRVPGKERAPLSADLIQVRKIQGIRLAKIERHSDRVDLLRAHRFAGAAGHAGIQGFPQIRSGGAALEGERAARERERKIPRLPPDGAGQDAHAAPGTCSVVVHQKITSAFRIMDGSAFFFMARCLSTILSPNARRI